MEAQRGRSIILDGLPLPPSHNDLLMVLNLGGRPRMVPTPEAKAFKAAMGQWRLQHLASTNRARAELVADLSEHQPLIRVDHYFIVRADRLWTLGHNPKKFDAFNRVKAFDDALATEVLGLDDCWIWAGLAEKVEAGDNDQECTILVLTPTIPRTAAEIRRKDASGRPVLLDEIPPGRIAAPWRSRGTASF